MEKTEKQETRKLSIEADRIREIDVSEADSGDFYSEMDEMRPPDRAI